MKIITTDMMLLDEFIEKFGEAGLSSNIIKAFLESDNKDAVCAEILETIIKKTYFASPLISITAKMPEQYVHGKQVDSFQAAYKNDFYDDKDNVWSLWNGETDELKANETYAMTLLPVSRLRYNEAIIMQFLQLSGAIRGGLPALTYFYDKVEKALPPLPPEYCIACYSKQLSKRPYISRRGPNIRGRSIGETTSEVLQKENAYLLLIQHLQ